MKSKMQSTSYPAEVQAKKRANADESSQHDSHISSRRESRSHQTPLTHSTDVSIGVSISQGHTHRESSHNMLSSSQKDGVGIKQRSLHPLEHTHMSLSNPFILHKHDLWPLP